MTPKQNTFNLFKPRLTTAWAWIQERRKPQAAWLVTVLLLLWVLSGTILMQNTRLIRQVEPTGDEPEYIMLCRSFIDEGDFNLEVDIATGVCSEFMSGRFQLRGKSIRPPGMPLFLVPAYLMGRHLPWPGLPYSLYLWMGLIYVWLGTELFLLIQAATNRPRLAWLTTLAAMLLPPLAPYAFQVYPELPAAVLLLRLFRREFYGSAQRERISDGICLALIPVFHQKYMFLFVMSGLHLVSGILLNRRKNILDWISVILPSVASLILLSLFFGHRFGIWLPTAPYSVNDSLLANLFTLKTLKVIFAQFLDRKWGLFMICPLMVFILPGIAALWHRRPWVWFWWITTCGGFLVLLSAYPLWCGGFSPPCRFLVPIVPLLWLATAQFWANHSLHRPAIIVGLILLILSMYFSGLMMFGSPYDYQICSPYLYPEESPNGSATWAAVSRIIDWNQLLPAMERNGRWNHILPDELRFGTRDWLKTGVIFCLLLLWTIELFRKPKTPSKDTNRIFRTLKTNCFGGVYLVFCLVFLRFLPYYHQSDSLLIRQHHQRELSQRSTTSFPLKITGAYGEDTGAWLKAPEPKFGIFYPPIYYQDMPDTLWSGGFSYQFSVPIWWEAETDSGSIVLSVENRITRDKQEARINWSPDRGRSILSVTCRIPENTQALFKIVMYGDNTSAYSYQPVSLTILPITQKSSVE
ncbi:hypothetical protein K8T06_08915 [bacterium]|nr:hypothetical protein [bacterium]